MTRKASISGVDAGGAKAVIIAKPEQKTEAFLRAYGRFVDTFHGRFVTGEDVGISMDDARVIGKETDYILGISEEVGNPSPFTAHGVVSGMRACTREAFGTNSLSGLRLAIQGVGAVGYTLARILHQEGAELIVIDIREERTKKASLRSVKGPEKNGNALKSKRGNIVSETFVVLGTHVNELDSQSWGFPFVAFLFRSHPYYLPLYLNEVIASWEIELQVQYGAGRNRLGCLNKEPACSEVSYVSPEKIARTLEVDPNLCACPLFSAPRTRSGAKLLGGISQPIYQGPNYCPEIRGYLVKLAINEILIQQLQYGVFKGGCSS